MEARAHVDGDRILVHFTAKGYDEVEEARHLARQVPGASWRPSKKAWAYPRTVDTCRKLRRVLGPMLKVHAELSAWYRVEAAATQEQVHLSMATDADLGVVPQHFPTLHANLGSWQKVGAAWLVNAYRNGALYVDEPGIGKTRGVLAGLLERGCGQMLIVCPKISVKTVWGNEIRRLIPELRGHVYLARGNRASREKVISQYLEDTAPQKVLVVVAEMLRIKGVKVKNREYRWTGYEYPQLFDVAWDAVVVDESHKLLGSLTITKGNLAGEGLRRIEVEAVRGLKLCVTGTPFGRGGRVQGMFGALHWCWPDEYGSFWRWAEEHFQVEEKFAGKTVGYVRKVVGLKPGRKEEDLYRSLGPRLLRRTMAEVKPDYTKPEYWELLCELEGAQLRQYRALAEDGEVKLPGGVLTTTGVLDSLTRARQSANGCLGLREDGTVYYTGESNKLDVLMDQLDERGILDGDGHLKVVIASQYTEFLGLLVDRLRKANVPHHYLHGGSSDRKRDKMQEVWQQPYDPETNPERVFLLSAKAGGVSINLDAADEMFQVDEMYPPEDNEQLHRRLIRMSRDHQVRIYYLRSEGTIDHTVAENVGATLMEQLQVLDGRRGLSVARQLMQYRPPEEG